MRGTSQSWCPVMTTDDTSVTGMVRPIYFMNDPESNGTVKRWYLEGPDAGRFNLKDLEVGLDE